MENWIFGNSVFFFFLFHMLCFPYWPASSLRTETFCHFSGICQGSPGDCLQGQPPTIPPATQPPPPSKRRSLPPPLNLARFVLIKRLWQKCPEPVLGLDLWRPPSSSSWRPAATGSSSGWSNERQGALGKQTRWRELRPQIQDGAVLLPPAPANQLGQRRSTPTEPCQNS